MSRAWPFLSKYGLDLLIVLAAVQSAIGTALRDDAHRPDGLMLWLEVAVMAALVLALVSRRTFPFAAPAALWLVTAALSFLDGMAVVTQGGVFLAGMGAALLLGNVRRDVQARVGLVIVIGGAAIVVYNDPRNTAGTGDLFVTPVLFAICWLVGFPLRERSAQTEAAEERAARAEREREAAARVAVAEERGRIARELHEVVAHAVSVMVLQVGADRHRMPVTDTEDRDTLRNVEQAGRTALAEMRRLLNAMRHDGDELELLPHPGLEVSTLWSTTSKPRGSPYTVAEGFNIVLGSLLCLLTGTMLGMLIRGSAGAIVAYFVYALVLPNISALLATSQDRFGDLQPWVDLNYAQGALFVGTLSSEQWANLAVTATTWLVLPAVLGLRLVMKSEVK